MKNNPTPERLEQILLIKKQLIEMKKINKQNKKKYESWENPNDEGEDDTDLL